MDDAANNPAAVGGIIKVENFIKFWIMLNLSFWMRPMRIRGRRSEACLTQSPSVTLALRKSWIFLEQLTAQNTK